MTRFRTCHPRHRSSASIVWVSTQQPLVAFAAGSKTLASEHAQQLQQHLQQQQQQEAALLQQLQEMTAGLQELQQQQHALEDSLTGLAAADRTPSRLKVSILHTAPLSLTHACLCGLYKSCRILQLCLGCKCSSRCYFLSAHLSKIQQWTEVISLLAS